MTGLAERNCGVAMVQKQGTFLLKTLIRELSSYPQGVGGIGRRFIFCQSSPAEKSMRFGKAMAQPKEHPL